MAATITPEGAWGGNRFLNLETIVGREMWPSPRATDGSKGGPNQRGSKGDLMLPSAVAQTKKAPGAGSLNPAWVAQLMNFPADWLDLPAGPPVPAKRKKNGNNPD
jgi:hypothetical protein